MGEATSYTQETIDYFVSIMLVDAEIIGDNLVFTHGHNTATTIPLSSFGGGGGSGGITEIDTSDARFIPIHDTDDNVKGYIGYSEYEGAMVIWNGNLAQFADGGYAFPYIAMYHNDLYLYSADAQTTLHLHDNKIRLITPSYQGLKVEAGLVRVVNTNAFGVDGTDTPTTTSELADILVALGVIESHTISAGVTMDDVLSALSAEAASRSSADDILDAKMKTIEPNNITGTSYTLALFDAGLVVELNNASPITLTVPPDSAVDYPIDTVIELWQQGAGQVSVVPGVGVTIRSSEGKLKLYGQYSGASLRKRGADEWVLTGDLVI